MLSVNRAARICWKNCLHVLLIPGKLTYATFKRVSDIRFGFKKYIGLIESPARAIHSVEHLSLPIKLVIVFFWQLKVKKSQFER